jgi:hypothetical protein
MPIHDTMNRKIINSAGLSEMWGAMSRPSNAPLQVPATRINPRGIVSAMLPRMTM